MKLLKQIQKPLANIRKWAFLFFNGRINRGTFQTAFRALQRKLYSWNIYTTLFNLPLKSYITISCDKTVNPLQKVSLRTPQWLLMEYYEELMKEYAVLSENKDVIFQQAKQNQIESVQMKLMHYTLCAQILVAVLNGIIKDDKADVAIEYLQNKGITAPDTESLLKRIETVMKNTNFQLKEMIFQSKQDKKETGSVTRADYAKIIAIANKNGYKVDYGMMTADFIQVLNIQRDEHKELEKLKTKK